MLKLLAELCFSNGHPFPMWGEQRVNPTGWSQVRVGSLAKYCLRRNGRAQQWPEPEPAVTPHEDHYETDCWLRGTTGWVQRRKERCMGDPHLSTASLPCQLPRWAGSQCTVSAQACTQETRALHKCSCKTARLPGWACRAERQMSSSWDISALQWSVGQQPQYIRSGHLEKLLQGIQTCLAFFFFFCLYSELANTQRPEGTVSALSCHAAGCKRPFRKMNFSPPTPI